MNSLDPSYRADAQIFGTNFVYAMNIADEIVTGQENSGGQKADVGGVTTSMYKLRPLATIGRENAIAVPENMLNQTIELSKYQLEIGANDLTPDRIIPIYGVEQYGFSGALQATYLSTKSSLDKLGINKIVGFIESPTLQRVREGMGFNNKLIPSIEVTENINNKGWFLDQMKGLGINTAPGFTVFGHDEAMKGIDTIKKMGAKTIYIKLSRSASGQGIFPITIDGKEDNQIQEILSLPHVIKQMNEIGLRIDFGVEGVVSSPSITLYIGKNESESKFVLASQQILGKNHKDDTVATVHKGNISDVDESIVLAMKSNAKRITKWMRSIGAYGIVGFDFVATNRGELFIMEANYRSNGAMSAAMKAHDLQSPHWAAYGGVRVPKDVSLERYIQYLQANQLEYRKGESGVLVLNHATSGAGSMQIAILGKTPTQIQDILSGVHMD